MSLAKNLAVVLVGSCLVLALAFAFAMPAHAANISNVEFDNGDVVYQGKGGETVKATFRVVVDANEVVEQFGWDVLGDSLAPKCVDVGGSRGLEQGTHFVDVDIKLPPNTGTYDVQTTAHGIYGGGYADDCVGDQVDSSSFNDSLIVSGTSNNDGTSGNSGSVSQWQAILNALLEIKASLSGSSTTPKPVCSQLAPLSAAAMPGTYSPANTSLQVFLMSNGGVIPAISSGAADYGFYGSQTAAALAQVKATNQCQ